MKERIAVQTSLLGIANKAFSLAAEASIHEEPGAGKPHAGNCGGCRVTGSPTALNFLPILTIEMLSFLQQLQEAP